MPARKVPLQRISRSECGSLLILSLDLKCLYALALGIHYVQANDPSPDSGVPPRDDSDNCWTKRCWPPVVPELHFVSMHKIFLLVVCLALFAGASLAQTT